MNVHELRLGNLVAPKRHITFQDAAEGFVSYRVGTFGCLPVRAINSECVTVEAPFHGSLFRQEVVTDDIVSIPLAEEVLLKCGFREVGCYDNVYHRDSFRIYLDKKAKQGLLKYETEDYHIEEEVKNVHQLQNLYFAISGSELPVSL